MLWLVRLVCILAHITTQKPLTIMRGTCFNWKMAAQLFTSLISLLRLWSSSWTIRNDSSRDEMSSSVFYADSSGTSMIQLSFIREMMRCYRLLVCCTECVDCLQMLSGKRYALHVTHFCWTNHFVHRPKFDVNMRRNNRWAINCIWMEEAGGTAWCNTLNAQASYNNSELGCIMQYRQQRVAHRCNNSFVVKPYQNRGVYHPRFPNAAVTPGILPPPCHNLRKCPN